MALCVAAALLQALVMASVPAPVESLEAPCESASKPQGEPQAADASAAQLSAYQRHLLPSKELEQQRVVFSRYLLSVRAFAETLLILRVLHAAQGEELPWTLSRAELETGEPPTVLPTRHLVRRVEEDHEALEIVVGVDSEGLTAGESYRLRLYGVDGQVVAQFEELIFAW